MPEVTRTSREIRVAAVPDGLPEPVDLAVAEVPVPVPGRAMLAIGGDGGDTDSSDASR